MKCCSAPSSRRPALPLHPLPPATVCKPKTKLKAKPNKFAPVVKYTTAENQEVKFESLLGEGTEVVLVRKKGAAREGVPPSHGVPFYQCTQGQATIRSLQRCTSRALGGRGGGRSCRTRTRALS